MSIVRDPELQMHCEECPEVLSSSELEDSPADFRDFVAGAQGAGWVCVETNSGWQHFCPACAEEMKLS